MRVYLDASVLIALLTHDPSTRRAVAYFEANLVTPIVSDFASAEFASALARRVRMGELAPAAAQAAFSHLDVWALRVAERVTTTSADVMATEAFLRRLDTPLRTPDALNIAICLRSSAALLTFDEKMATAARSLGLDVVAA